MNSKLHVGNLSFNTDDNALRAAFEKFGQITDTYVATDRITGRARGFAFVTFATAEEAQAALEKLNGTDLDGRALQISEAKPKESFSGSRASASSRY